MDKELDIIEIKILGDLVGDELERMYKNRVKNNSEAQREFDLRTLLHKLRAIEGNRKWKNINYMMFLTAGAKRF